MNTFCGTLALFGRPNVGKSTLLNALVEEKISITSRKPQTTRHRVLGVRTTGAHQMIFIDTPGVDPSARHHLNQRMNKMAWGALDEADLIALVTEGVRWSDQEQALARALPAERTLWIINKVDTLASKARLLPHLSTIQAQHQFSTVLPISALKARDIERVATIFAARLPQQAHRYPSEMLTDRSEHFLTQEWIREQLMRWLGDEIPYATSVLVEKFQVQRDDSYAIHAQVIVDRASQKKILIGKNASLIKKVSAQARHELSKLFQRPVHLMLWVRVEADWFNNSVLLDTLGYTRSAG